jgi:hypothetical protein
MGRKLSATFFARRRRWGFRFVAHCVCLVLGLAFSLSVVQGAYSPGRRSLMTAENAEGAARHHSGRGVVQRLFGLFNG